MILDDEGLHAVRKDFAALFKQGLQARKLTPPVFFLGQFLTAPDASPFLSCLNVCPCTNVCTALGSNSGRDMCVAEGGVGIPHAYWMHLATATAHVCRFGCSSPILHHF